MKINLVCRFVWLQVALLLMPIVGLTQAATSENPLQLVPDHATLSVADMAKERDWYIHVLGFREINHFERGADLAASQLAIPGYRIDLLWAKGSSRSIRASGFMEQGWYHVVFKTPVIEDVYKNLMAQKADVTPDKDAKSAVTRLIVHDPEGNEIEILPNSSTM